MIETDDFFLKDLYSSLEEARNRWLERNSFDNRRSFEDACRRYEEASGKFLKELFETLKKEEKK